MEAIRLMKEQEKSEEEKQLLIAQKREKREEEKRILKEEKNKTKVQNNLILKQQEEQEKLLNPDVALTEKQLNRDNKKREKQAKEDRIELERLYKEQKFLEIKEEYPEAMNEEFIHTIFQNRRYKCPNDWQPSKSKPAKAPILKGSAYYLEEILKREKTEEQGLKQLAQKNKNSEKKFELTSHYLVTDEDYNIYVKENGCQGQTYSAKDPIHKAYFKTAQKGSNYWKAEFPEEHNFTKIRIQNTFYDGCGLAKAKVFVGNQLVGCLPDKTQGDEWYDIYCDRIGNQIKITPASNVSLVVQNFEAYANSQKKLDDDAIVVVKKIPEKRELNGLACNEDTYQMFRSYGMIVGDEPNTSSEEDCVIF